MARAGLLVALLAGSPAWAGDAMVKVGPGTYAPLYPVSEQEETLSVPAFWLDPYPVTNGEFLAFVDAHPRWARDQIPALYRDARYLSHWSSAHALGPEVEPTQPVTHVSWFAARAYCAVRGARLPTESEWELAAMASPTQADATEDAAWRQQILDWYATPSSKALPGVGERPPNIWGVYDLHGLVWEWVEDFRNSVVVGDPREGGDEERLRFCGSGAVTASDASDYASFMRFAFRSALEANYATRNLGFRCAKDAPP